MSRSDPFPTWADAGRSGTGLSRRGALGLGLGALAACGRTPAADRLSWWAMSTVGENAPLLLPDFERKTGTRVEVQALPWTGAHEKLLTANAGGSLPDVMMVANGWIPELVLVGALAAVPGSARTLIDDQFPSVAASMRIGQRGWAVPWTVDSWLQFYRRDLLAAVGYDAPSDDWSEWTTMAHAIKRRAPDRFVTLALLDWPEQLMTFAAQQSDTLLRDADSRGNFRSPGFRAALGFYKSLFDLKFAPPVTGAEAGDTVAAFQQGWFAILPSKADILHDFAARPADFPPSRWGAAETPARGGRGVALADGTALAVSATCRQPARAWQLVDFLCQPATQLVLHRFTGDLPARPSAWRMPALHGDPVDAVFARQIARSVAPPAVPEWERIKGEVQRVAEQLVRGDYSVDAAATEIDRRVDQILAKRRWLLERGRPL